MVCNYFEGCETDRAINQIYKLTEVRLPQFRDRSPYSY